MTIAALLAWGLIAVSSADEPHVVVEWVDPGAAIERVNRWCRTTRFAYPAAAMAAWKRAVGPLEASQRLPNKALDAAVTLFNPGMVEELRRLDGLRLELAPRPKEPGWTWRAIVPDEDGVLNAFVTANALTTPGVGPIAPDGIESNFNDLPPIERLSIEPLVLVTRRDGRLLLGPDTAALAKPVPTPAGMPAGSPPIDPGSLVVRLTPQRLNASASDDPDDNQSDPVWRLWNAFARTSGCREVVVVASPTETGTRLDLRAEGARLDLLTGAIRPEWVACVPSESAVAALTLGLNPTPQAWNDFFRLLDALDKTNPANRTALPLRSRLATIALVARANLERFVFPNLIGLTAWAGWDATRAEPARSRVVWTIALHFPNAEAAGRAGEELLKLRGNLAGLLGGSGPTMGAAGSSWLIASDPVTWNRSREAVKAGGQRFDDPLWQAAREAGGDEAPPTRLAWVSLDRLGDHAVSQRWVPDWLGELPRPTSCAPLVWVGRTTPEGGQHDRLEWSGAVAWVEAIVSAIPNDVNREK